MLAAPSAPFARLWQAFLTARMLVALALLLLLSLGAATSHAASLALPGTAFAYLVVSALTRVLAGREPPPPRPSFRWLPTIGVDIALIGLLQALQPAGTINFAPLFGLPVLMAAVLGNLLLALGTAASATLVLLAWAFWPGGGDATHYLQAALTGTGYFLVAYLAHQLAARLISEQDMAQRSRMDARAQRAVSALVMQHVADGVLVLDRGGHVHLANPAALLLLERSAAATLPFPLAHMDAWAPALAVAQQTFASGQAQHADVRIAIPGRPLLALRLRSWLTHAPQDLTHELQDPLCVMFLHDLREMEARLRTEKLASMGRMSAAVAHEIRNPLAAIMQANALLEEELQDPGQQRLAQMVRQNAERLVRITEDVLDIARVQHQIGHAPSAVVPLDATVRQVWQDWQAQEPQRRRGRLELAASELQVEFDAEHLRRVLVNLLDNALRYMGPHPDSLVVATQAGNGGRASLQVWSDGEPLDASIERHLFEPFFSSESRSSGLGLYICRELCQRHGAGISYQRSDRVLERGAVAGNAFTVLFRGSTAAAEPPSLFDTIVV